MHTFNIVSKIHPPGVNRFDRVMLLSEAKRDDITKLYMTDGVNHRADVNYLYTDDAEN